jgi:putative oxidoreductase
MSYSMNTVKGATFQDKPATGNNLLMLLDRLYMGLTWLSPIADLALRLWVAQSFFKAGLTKIQNFDSTIFLFTHEYHVPLLSPEIAAYMGTATELSMPVLLVLGLMTRMGAGVLFVFNFIAVASYPDISIFKAIDHQAWALMLLVTVLHGPGRLSLDYFIRRQYHRWPV